MSKARAIKHEVPSKQILVRFIGAGATCGHSGL
jgi:hypothetical protein